MYRSWLANGRTWPKILGEWAWPSTKLQTYLLQGRSHILRYFYGNLFFLTADLFLCTYINLVHKNLWYNSLDCVLLNELCKRWCVNFSFEQNLSAFCYHVLNKNGNKLLANSANHPSHWVTSETLPETIESGPLCITNLFQNKIRL